MASPALAAGAGPAVTDPAALGLLNPGPVRANLAAAAWTELALARGEGFLSDKGALVAHTGDRTGRSPRDRYVVADDTTKDVVWWGPVNQPMEPAAFDRLHDKVRAYFQGRELFVFDGWACADPRHRLPVRVVAEKAWHALFAHCLLLRPPPGGVPGFRPRLTVLHAAGLFADPRTDGTRGGVF